MQPRPPGRSRAIAYWIATLVLATECLVGGAMGGLRLPPFIGVIGHLGYPAYFMTILGAWYVLAGLALLAPRSARLKEWAYAGLVFNYTGAAASHLAVGDGAGALVAPILFTGLTVASWAWRPAARRDSGTATEAHGADDDARRLRQDDAATSHSRSRGRTRTVVYWVTTLLVVAEMGVGGAWDILRIPFVRTILGHLGYPVYLALIMGVWKVPGALALLVPRHPRLAEWAYAGAFFTYSGAVASHLAVGDGAGALVAPIVFAALTVASWALRPPDRGGPGLAAG
jgi:uncharacterized membrane protein